MTGVTGVSKAGADIPSVARLLAYSAPAIPLAVMLIPLNAFLPFFYNGVVGMEAAAVGFALFAARMADVVVDPICGLLSDRTRSRFGRRRSWMVAGLPVFTLGAWAVFHPPDGAGFLYLLVTAFAVYAGWSMIQLPYLAWGAEAVTGYDARAKLSGWRETGTVIGVVVAASIPIMTAYWGHGIDRFTMSLIGWFLVVAMPLTVLLSLGALPDPPFRAGPEAPRDHFSPRALLTFRRPFLMIIGAFISIGLAKGIGNALTVYYATYILEAPEVVGYVLFSAYAGMLLGIPLWVRLAHRIGKHRGVTLSLVLTMALLLVAVQLGPGDGWLFVALEFVVGLVAGGYFVLPPAVVADAVDYDALRGRDERFGLHFATWSMVQKLVNALAVAIALPLLSLSGFEPGGANQGLALEMVRFAYLVLPAPLFLLGAFLFWRFPIDSRRHGIIRRRLERRASASLAAS